MESALKGNGWVICYPIYLDAKKTIAEGRRVPKEKAVENPTFDEVQMCLQALKLEHVGFVRSCDIDLHELILIIHFWNYFFKLFVGSAWWRSISSQTQPQRLYYAII